MLLSALQSKDVISTIDGKNYGKIVDIEIDEQGTIIYFVIEKRKFFWRLFSSNPEINITIKQIKKIGEDVILVES